MYVSVFDEYRAELAVRFFTKHLRHFEGEWAGQPFRPAPWQIDRVIRPLFGTLREDGVRQYRTVFVFLPRKNGKSTLASGIALKLLLADGEPAAQVYSAAADREQAHVVFDAARTFVETSKALRKRCKVYRRHIAVPRTRSVYRVLSSDAGTKHGRNVHGLVADELHVWKGALEGSLFEALMTASDSRRQAVRFIITTAGYDRKSICYAEYKYAKNVLEGVIDDPSYLPVIFEAPADAPVDDPDVWAIANPNLGISVRPDALAEAAKRALESPADENMFRRLRLNQWTEQESRWIPVATWKALADRGLDREALEGLPCTAGLDLSSTEDLSAFVLAFELPDGRVVILPYFWVPEDTAHTRQRKERVPYLHWIKQGLVIATPGAVVDYAFIRHEVNQLGRRFDIREIAFDPWQAMDLATKLDHDGFQMVQHRQGFGSMAAPMQTFQRLWKGARLIHDGNECLTYQAANLAVKQDPAGNLKPSKEHSGDRIDGMVAAIMACGRLILENGVIDTADDVVRTW